MTLRRCPQRSEPCWVLRTLRTPIRAALLGVVAALGVAASAHASCPDDGSRLDQVGASRVERSVLCLLNERRQERGVRPLRADGRLARSAQSHTGSMVAEGFFSHDSLDGSDFIDRIRRTGYLRGAIAWLVGENLVWGTGERGTPASLVRAWMRSPGHRATLLRGTFRDVGIAAVGGTPHDSAAAAGVTVTSDFGYRARPGKARRARRPTIKVRSSIRSVIEPGHPRG